jgi:hypothetical protein
VSVAAHVEEDVDVRDIELEILSSDEHSQNQDVGANRRPSSHSGVMMAFQAQKQRIIGLTFVLVFLAASSILFLSQYANYFWFRADYLISFKLIANLILTRVVFGPACSVFAVLYHNDPIRK